MRVLVCDDDAGVGGFLTTMFMAEGWDSHLVASGEACLAELDKGSAPDALVLDQVMPGLTGIETAEKLRTDGFARPIILCSGYLGPDLNSSIERLDLIPVSKMDLQALVRVVRAAVQSASRPAQSD